MQRNLKSGQGITYSIFGGNKLTQNDVQAITNYANALKSGLGTGEAWTTNMKNCSVAAKQYIVSAKRAGQSTDELVTGLKTVPKATTAASVGLKALSIAGNMLAMWAITEGIQLAAKLVDKLIVTTEELKESADNAVNELNNLQSEADSLNQELTTTRDRITELENKPSLSFIEQEELQKLRDASTELERQIELNKTLRNVQEGKTRDSALDYLNKQTQYEGYGGWDMSQVRNGNARYGIQNVGTIFQGNQLEVAERQLQEYENIAKRKENVEKRITSFKIANPDETKYTQDQKDALTNLQFELQSYDSTLKALNDSLYEVIPNLDTYKNVLNPDYDQSYIDFIDKLIDGYNQLFGNSSGTKTEKFDDIWNSDDFKTYKSELESLAKEGKLDASVLESNEQYKKLLEETGATAEETAQHINSLVSAEQGTANVKFSKSEMISAINGMSEGFEELDKIYKSISDKNPFDFKLLDDKNFKETFDIPALEKEYTSFIETVSSSPDDINACKDAFDNLVSAWIDSTGILDKVDEGNAKVTASMLKMMGVANSDVLVQEALTKAKANSAYESNNLSNATSQEIIGLINESGATDEARESFGLYIAQKMVAEAAIDTSGDISALANVVSSLGLATSAWQRYYAAKQRMALITADPNFVSYEEDGSVVSKDAVLAQYSKIAEDSLKEYAQDLEDKAQKASYSGGNKSNSSSGSSGSSGSSSNKDFDWMELKLKKIEQLRTKLQNQSNNSFLTYMGLTDEEVRQAEKIANELTGIYGESISKIEDLLPSGESDKKITDVMSAIQNQINVLSGSYDKVVSEDTINDLQSLSSMANTAGLSLEEFINLIKSGGRESRQSALASLIEYNKQTLPEYEKAVKEYGKKYAEALSKLPEEIRDKVEHGGEGIESFSGQLAEDIQAAIDYGEKLSDAETTLASKKQESQDTIKSFYEDEINYLDAEYQKLENSSNLIEAEIDYLNESGRIVNATSYESIIANLQQQEKIIDKKIAEKKAELRALMENDENYKNSPEYYELLDSLGECEKAQKELNKLEEQYNRQLREMPVDNLDKVISMSNSIIDAMENWRAEQEAFGKKVNAEYYQELIINGAKTIDQYKEQADLIEDIMDEYEIGSEPWLDMYDRLKQCNTEMSSMVQNLQKWNEELLQMPIDNIATYTDDLNKVLTALNSVKSDHETVINAVVAAIDDEIDRLNDEKEVYEKNVNDEIDILQDKLDLYNKQNEALKLQRDYEQALYDLQVANTQKTEAVIRNGEKVYETNADNIRNAQSSVTDALEALKENEIQTQIDDLNDALDAYNDKLEDQIDALEKIKEKWSEIATEREKADNAALATEILGNGWQNKVITGNDNDIYTMFKNLYNSNIDQINQYQDQITSTENIESLIQDYITSYKEGTISYQEAQAGIQNLLSQMNEKMTSDENLQNVYDYLSTVHDTDANGNAILEGIQKSLDKTSDELLDAFEQYNENIAMIGEYTTSWEQLTNNVDEMRDLLEEVRDNLEDALDAASDRDDNDDGGSSGHWLSGDSGNGPGVHAKGILAGKVGGDSNTEKDKMIKYLTTHELEPGQIPIIADKGEYVVNPEQQELLLENYGRAMNNLTGKLLIPSIDYSKFGTTTKSQDINVNFEKGSIVLNEVQNVDEFAKAMDKNFALKMGQLLSKYDRFH